MADASSDTTTDDAAELRALVARLRADNAALLARSEQLTADNAVLEQARAELTADNAALEAARAELAAKYAWLQNQVFGRRAERFEDPAQQQLFTDGERESTEVRQTEAVAGHTRRAHKRGGRMRIDPDLPRVTILHQLPPQDLLDPTTGEPAYEAFGFRTTEKLAYTPIKLYVEQHQHVKYRLTDRGRERLTDADPPEALTAPPTLEGLDRCLAAPSLLAELLHAKFALHTLCVHVPFDRLLKDLRRRTGVKIANATVSRWAQQFATLAEPLTDLMRRRMITHSTVIQHDDSPVRQLPKKKSGQRRCATTRFWSAVGERGGRGDYVVIAHTPTRGGHHVRAWLGDPADDERLLGRPRALRFLQCDEYAGYDALFNGTGNTSDAPLERVGCLAHARRKWSDLRTSHPACAHAALAHLQRLYAVERELAALRDDADPATFDYPAWHATWHATRRRVRQERAAPRLDAYFAWCRETLAGQPLPRHPIAAAARYSLNQEADLRRYAEHGQLEIDNNACERSIRPLCLGKKNWLFTGSPDAGRAAATIFTLVAGAARHGRNPHAYLEHLLHHLRPLGPNPSDEALERLLPDRWTPEPTQNTAASQEVVG